MPKYLKTENICLNNLWAKEEIKKEIRKKFLLNENEKIRYQNL